MKSCSCGFVYCFFFEKTKKSNNKIPDGIAIYAVQAANAHDVHLKPVHSKWQCYLQFRYFLPNSFGLVVV